MDTSRYELRRCHADDNAPTLMTRLREIYRDSVLHAGPQHYDASQVAAWAQSADDVDAWKTWMAEGATWIAVERVPTHRVVGVGMRWPADHLHLLYVDPTVQRRGIATALLEACDRDAREAGIDAITADASLLSHPVFAGGGYTVVEWQAVERRGQVFRRARMSKALR